MIKFGEFIENGLILHPKSDERTAGIAYLSVEPILYIVEYNVLLLQNQLGALQHPTIDDRFYKYVHMTGRYKIILFPVYL